MTGPEKLPRALAGATEERQLWFWTLPYPGKSTGRAEHNLLASRRLIAETYGVTARVLSIAVRIRCTLRPRELFLAGANR
jgi:hypothetical protein